MRWQALAVALTVTVTGTDSRLTAACHRESIRRNQEESGENRDGLDRVEKKHGIMHSKPIQRHDVEYLLP
jgi:hypothetical protein